MIDILATRLGQEALNRQVVAVLEALEGPGSPEGKVLNLYRNLQPQDRRIFIEDPPALSAHTTKLVQEDDGTLVVYLDPKFILNRNERANPMWEEVCRQLAQTVVCVIDPAQIVVQEIDGRHFAYTTNEFEALAQG